LVPLMKKNKCTMAKTGLQMTTADNE